MRCYNLLHPIRCLLLLLHPAEINNVRFCTTKHTKYRNKTCMHSCAQTYTILTRNPFPNSSPLWAWIILISPLPFSKPWLANLLVPLNLTYDTFYITQSLLPQKYWKDVLPKHWRPSIRLLDVTNQNTRVWTFLVLLICSNPFWVLFTHSFEAPYVLSTHPPFRNQLNVQQGPQTLHSQALWSYDTSSWLHIRSWNYTLCPIIYWWSQTWWFSLDEPNQTSPWSGSFI